MNKLQFKIFTLFFIGIATSCAQTKQLIPRTHIAYQTNDEISIDGKIYAVPKAKSTAAILLSNLLLFTVVFSVLGLALKSVLGLNNYLSAWQRK